MSFTAHSATASAHVRYVTTFSTATMASTTIKIKSSSQEGLRLCLLRRDDGRWRGLSSPRRESSVLE